MHCSVVQVKEAAKELGYQPTDTFCLKVSQLREIFKVCNSSYFRPRRRA